RARVIVGALDLGRAVSAVVDLEDVGVEVLDPEREARDAEARELGQLDLRERARLALERHFFDLVPGEGRAHALEQLLQLLGREVRRRAAAEVDEQRLAALEARVRGVERELAPQARQIAADL